MTGIRVVFDCNIFLQALGSPDGPAGRCVQLAFDGEITLFVSPEVLEELREVTSRPRVITKLCLDLDRVEEFFDAIDMSATLLTGFPDVFRYQRDPKDSRYINLALAANARLIVSRDKDLLDLMDSATREGSDFQTQFPGLRILDPVAFLIERQSIKPGDG